jgi:hypothetical protein
MTLRRWLLIAGTFGWVYACGETVAIEEATNPDALDGAVLKDADATDVRRSDGTNEPDAAELDGAVDGAPESKMPAVWSRGCAPALDAIATLSQLGTLQLAFRTAGLMTCRPGEQAPGPMIRASVMPNGFGWSATTYGTDQGVPRYLSDLQNGPMVGTAFSYAGQSYSYTKETSLDVGLLRADLGAPMIFAAAAGNRLVQVVHGRAEKPSFRMSYSLTAVTASQFLIARYTSKTGTDPEVADKIFSPSEAGAWATPDAMVMPSASEIYIAGRYKGPFDFGGGAVSGAGHFLARYNADDLSLTWLKTFGGEVLVERGPSDGLATVGVRLLWEAGSLLLSVPYAGEINFGNRALPPAPSGAHAVGVARLEPATGAALMSASFPKGPASAGKFSRPTVRYLGDQRFAIFDTVWDTVEIGGTVVRARQGADAYLATFDSTGRALRTRVFDGAGEERALWLGRASDNGDFYLLGHSSNAIDLGNGPLLISREKPEEGQVWIARVPAP